MTRCRVCRITRNSSPIRRNEWNSLDQKSSSLTRADAVKNRFLNTLAAIHRQYLTRCMIYDSKTFYFTIRMLITAPFFTRKIQNVATTDKATWQFFFWTIMNHYPRWFPSLLLAIFQQFSVYQSLNQVLNPCCPQRSALSTRFSVILSLARRLLLPGMGEVTMKRGWFSGSWVF